MMTQHNSPQTKKVFFNQKQVEFYAGQCNTTFAFCGRGFGKTNKITSNRLHVNFTEMPRSLNLIGCKTYKSVIFNIIPGVVKAFDSYGYIEGKDYWIGTEPPKAKVPRSIYRIPEYDRAFTFLNGSIGLFGSVDRGFYNSLSFDSAIFEEVRLVKKENLDEILPAIRGNKDMPWSTKWCHLGKLFVTDKPKLATERWLYDMIRDNKPDPEIIRWIFILSKKIYELQEMAEHAKEYAQLQRIQYKIKRLESDLNQLKKSTIYVFEASTFDNAEILGIEAIKQLRQSLTDREFLRAVQNEDVLGDGKGFYFLLGPQHKYNAVDYHQYEIGNIDFRNPSNDCRWDADMAKDAPLHIACDWGQFNCMSIGQFIGDQFKFINKLYVEPPKMTTDLADMFADYYRFRTNRDLIIHFDQTAIGEDGKSLPYIDQLCQRLEAKGFDIERRYHGAAPLHGNKYELWQQLLSMKVSDDRPFIAFNEYNCEDLLLSMEGARVKLLGKTLQKDKSDERKAHVNQVHTTHLSDSADQLVWGLFRDLLPGFKKNSFMPHSF